MIALIGIYLTSLITVVGRHSAPKKVKKKITPTDKVIELLLHGQSAAYLVSSSKPILDTEEAYKQDQPPHIQAKNTYKDYLEKVNGSDFLVTMEEPNASKPEPLVFEISGKGIRRRKASIGGSAAIISSSIPRAGAGNV